MNRLLGALALVASVTVATSPAMAATSFVQDGAGMFSVNAIAHVTTPLTNFNAQTHKEVVVVTVPSLPNGQTVQQAADAAFAAQSINGTLIYVAQNEHKIFVLPGKNEAAAGWFTADGSASIVADMSAHFKAGDNDAALTAGVNDVLNIYRSHVNSSGSSSRTNSSTSSSGSSFGGIPPQMLWILVAIVAFFIIRSFSRPRYYGPPGGGVAPGPQGGMPMGYGGGYGGGGGGFWSGLLGGLGGAWLGNEMFRGGGGGIGGIGGGTDGGGTSAPGDSGGWANDAGQSGDSGSAGGDWGGGGWGGGGDSGGGGGGGDSGGAGGGW